MRVRRMSARMTGIQRALVGLGVVTVLLPMAVIVIYNNDNAIGLVSDQELNLQKNAPRLKKLLSIDSESYQDGMRTSRRYQSSEDFCAHHEDQTIKPDMFKHIIVNDKYKIMYCQIPKVACTNWRRMMLILTGKMNTSDPMKLKAPAVHKDYDKHLTYLSDLSVDEIKHRLKTYYKFVFTREPFERILSAYRNKFKEKNPFFHKRYGRNIVKRYRANSGQSPSGKDVSFYEYVLYLTDYTRREPMNEHWERMTHLCHPCLVKYDLVSSYDDLETNSDRLLRKIGAPAKVKFPKRGQSYKHKGTEELLRQYYRQIPSGLLDQLMEVYYSDFLMFKYKIPASMRNLTKWQMKLSH